jgi:hypothetical protein
VAGVPIDYIRALHKTGTIKTIVDHDHYNPRIIEWMTDMAHLYDATADAYPLQFVSALSNPELIWDKAFRNHIPRRCRHLLFALYYASEYGAEIEDVREIFEGVHPLLCAAFSISSDVKDFEESVRTLEGSFIAIANGRVSFINPSVRDYLASYLNDKALLILMAAGASNASCAARMVDQFEKLPRLNGEDWRAMLCRFSPLCGRLNRIPQWHPIPSEPGSLRHYDWGHSARIKMLLSWWRTSRLPIFIETAIGIAIKPYNGFSAWDDARELPEILTDLRTAGDKESNNITALADAIEAAIHNLLGSYLDPDGLDRIVKSIDRNESVIGHTFLSDIAAAIPRMIDRVADNLGHIDSQSTLSDFVLTVEALAQRVEYNASAVALAKRAIQQRIEEVSDAAASEDELPVTGEVTRSSDVFGDRDLNNLFAPLVWSED